MALPVVVVFILCPLQSLLACELTVLTRYETLDRALRAAATVRRHPDYAGRQAVILDDAMPGGGRFYAVVAPGRQARGYALNGDLRGY